MRPALSPLRAAAIALILLGVLSGAFAAGRSTVAGPQKPNPVQLEQGIAVGVVRTPAGALAAADNYVATGITASLDPPALRRFADTAIDPTLRARFIAASQAGGQRIGPPPGARALGLVIAHRLDSYGAGRAEVSTWGVGSYWDGGSAPAQYWALVDVSLQWGSGHWQVAALQESLPGPVPALVGGPAAGRSAPVWDRWLSGMSAPLYGSP